MSAASEIEAIIGGKLMQELCDRFGGIEVYIPQTPPSRDNQIAELLEIVMPAAPSVMTAYREVADTLHVSVRTVQRISSTH